MQTIDTLVRSVQIIAVIIVVLLAIFGAVGFYFMKIHRSRVQEKHLDYSQFRRLDSLEYVKFDDVGEYMVVADGKSALSGQLPAVGASSAMRRTRNACRLYGDTFPSSMYLITRIYSFGRWQGMSTWIRW